MICSHGFRWEQGSRVRSQHCVVNKYIRDDFSAGKNVGHKFFRTLNTNFSKNPNLMHKFWYNLLYIFNFSWVISLISLVNVSQQYSCHLCTSWVCNNNFFRSSDRLFAYVMFSIICFDKLIEKNLDSVVFSYDFAVACPCLPMYAPVCQSQKPTLIFKQLKILLLRKI